MNNSRVLILGLLVLQSCSSVGNVGRDELKPGVICGIEGFTVFPSEHKTVGIEKPFIVRAVKGKLMNTFGEWPKDPPFPTLFEIRRMGGTAIIQASIDGEGNFKLPSVPEGQYCFKATAYLWESVMGIIIVSKKASHKKSIQIIMERDS